MVGQPRGVSKGDNLPRPGSMEPLKVKDALILPA